ncbi:unannotated protein [freshwater metagenome]|uniref:Unannotated protein n=1 Tax=freshwater metagenome TaxID=449393 RepID=A0A6J6G0L7_9ZZZZ
MNGAGRGWQCNALAALGARSERRSDSEQVAGATSALQHPASLPLGGAAPHAVVDAVVEGVAEALCRYWAGGADALGHFDTDAIAREEGGGGLVLAVAVIHPGGGGIHVPEGTDGG